MKAMLNSLISRVLVDTGQALELAYADGSSYLAGTPSPGRETLRLKFEDAGAVRALLLDPEMRLGELYMDGRIELENGTIFDLLMMLGGIDARQILSRRLLTGLRKAVRVFQQFNTPKAARANVAHHYDLDSGLYELFLDADRQYSCAYFEREDASLDEAQLAKKRHIASKLRLEQGMRVLDIGSGWGGLGIYLAETAGVDVTGVTLSEHQHRISNERARERGLAERVRFELLDYRKVKGHFDRIVSVGMFEHVGARYYLQYFQQCSRLLSPYGVMLLHTIGRLEPRGGANPWIQRYIFPGGYIPSLSEAIEAMEKAALRITDVEILRHHYALTLRHWRKRFLARREDVLRMFDGRFLRMWEFYLAACEMAFIHRNLSVFQIQASPRIDTLPITRDYLREARDSLQHCESPHSAAA